MIRVEYSSNNSGGSWWLTDADWKNLEAAGWTVDWRASLGALATGASKEFPSMNDAIAEWERITGQNAEDAGCECCGPPHYFSEARAVWDYDEDEQERTGRPEGGKEC